MESGKTRSEKGSQAERLAEAYLIGQGMRLLECNYRCRGGEIDLVMDDAGTRVFVEVRYRKHQAFGGAAASVDWRKQQRLIHAAQHYLQRLHASNLACRFDVVAVSTDRQGNPSLDWIKNAIELD